MVFSRKTKMELKKFMPGIIIGALAGVVAAYYSIQSGLADLTQIAEAGKGVIDVFLNREAPVSVGTTKLYVAFALVGAIFGYLVDKIMWNLGVTKKRTNIPKAFRKGRKPKRRTVKQRR